nr:CapA family protein [Solirubrobacterales bacterium]
MAPVPKRPWTHFLPLFFLAGFALALGLVIGLSGAGAAGSSTQAQAQTGAGDTFERRPPSPPKTISVGWAGDTVLGSRHGIPPNGGRDLLSGVRDTLLEPDVMIGNLEGVVGTRGAAKCPLATPNCFAFQAPPVAADTLAWAGFDVMNLANNHANDYGPLGLADTTASLNSAQVMHTGLGPQIAVIRRKGVSVAVIGFAAYPWAARLDDIPAAVRLVHEAAQVADVVVVVMHAGGEGTGQMHTPVGEEVAFGERRGDTRAFAHAVVDAGADAVFGSGPHVIRGVELRRNAPIIYSTGNLVGYHTFPTTGALALSAIVEVRIDARGRFLGGGWTPLR